MRVGEVIGHPLRAVGMVWADLHEFGGVFFVCAPMWLRRLVTAADRWLIDLRARMEAHGRRPVSVPPVWSFLGAGGNSIFERMEKGVRYEEGKGEVAEEIDGGAGAGGGGVGVFRGGASGDSPRGAKGDWRVRGETAVY